jgi:hypothetical protein
MSTFTPHVRPPFHSRLRAPPIAGPAKSAGRPTAWLVAELPEPFREAIILREMNSLSYQEITQVAGFGTVMSRLARARAMLRAAWSAAETVTTRPGPAVASGTAS